MANLKLLKRKVLITGANGLLGQKLVEVFRHDFEVYGIGTQRKSRLKLDGYDYLQNDVTHRKNTISLIKSIGPAYLVNAAAYTDVDGSEEEREQCWKVNVTGVENLAAGAKAAHAFMLHVSTDYVFDGLSGNYDEESKPNPLGYYGKSKLAGENALMGSGVEYAIARTMVLYGTGHELKPNFATWLVTKLRHKEPVKIVDDQHGHPTLVDDLAGAILRIVEKKKSGVFHAAGQDCVSRYDFARKLAQVFGFDTNLISRIRTEQLNQKAPRPLNSHFNLAKLHTEIGFKLSGIDDGLKELKRQLQLT